MKIFPGAGNAAFHRTRVDAEGYGNFFVCLPQVIAQIQNFTLPWIEFVHARIDVCQKLPVCCITCRIAGLAGNDLRERGFTLIADG